MFATRKLFNDPAMSVKRKIIHDAKVDIPSSGKLIHLIRGKVPTIGSIKGSVVQPAHLQLDLRFGKGEFLVQTVDPGDEGCPLLHHITR